MSQCHRYGRSCANSCLEADRCADVASVPLKTPEQQGIQALHRTANTSMRAGAAENRA
jgi:hypothetical protein